MGRYARGGAFKTVSAFAVVVGLVMITVFVARSALRSAESNTPAGSDVVVRLQGGGTVTFATVSGAGTTSKLEFPARAYDALDHDYPLKCADISTSAVYSGGITVRLPYRLPRQYSEDGIRLLHSATGIAWRDVTTSIDKRNDRVTGRIGSLWRFAVVYLKYPGVTRVMPRIAAKGSTVSMRISGLGFWSTPASDPSVRLQCGSESIAGTNVVVHGAKRIICDVAIPPGASTGPWRVIVTSPDGYDTIDHRYLKIVDQAPSAPGPLRSAAITDPPSSPCERMFALLVLVPSRVAVGGRP